MDPADATRTVGAKDGALAPGAGRRIPAVAWDARQAARQLLADAEEEAGRIRGGAAEVVEAARAAGVEAGHAEGLARAAAGIALAALERERLLAGCAAELIDLAVGMAGRILVREVRPGADAVAAAERALAVLGSAPRVTLWGSPGDVDALRRAGEEIGAGLRRLRLVADAALGPGEVIVEADGARVDGRFRVQLAELRRAIDAGTP